jgi:hypothetical protein
MKQTVDVEIKLTYRNQESHPIDGKTQPTRETIMRDLYELLKDGKCPPYKETRRSQHKTIHSER